MVYPWHDSDEEETDALLRQARASYGVTLEPWHLKISCLTRDAFFHRVYVTVLHDSESSTPTSIKFPRTLGKLTVMSISLIEVALRPTDYILTAT